MFYGRMLVGSEYNDKAFSANHSFYDSSGLKEYWDDSRSSVRVYPYFKEIKNSIKVYPIISPGKLRLTLNITDFKEKILAQKCLGLIKSPDNKFIDVSVNNLVKSFGLPAEEISSFSLITIFFKNIFIDSSGN